jgi:hypothetical protein
MAQVNLRTAPSTIFGIPCRLKTARARRAVRDVLRQIRARHPKDFAKLQMLVREIRPVTKQEAANGTLGEWKADHEDPYDQSTWGYGCSDTDTPGVMFVSEHDHGLDLRGVIAQEFGHACSSELDRSRRYGPNTFIKDEWASELAADWFAYKWGFGRVIARDRKFRDWRHHAPAPGSRFSVTVDSVEHHFRVTRNFVIRPA